MSKPIGKHTPGPWRYRAAQKGLGDERLDTGIFAEIDGANRIIAECFGRVGQSIYLNSEVNASHIVRAVNNQERLVEALRGLLDMATDNRTHGPEIDAACTALRMQRRRGHDQQAS